MNIEVNNITFSINISSLHDEIMEKMTELSNIQLQFIKKYQNKLSNSQLHASMVFFLRNALFKIQEIFKDVKSYFQDLDLTFVYQLFRKIYLFVVTGYNFTTEAFSIALSDCKDITQQTSKQKQQNTRKPSIKGKFDPYRKMQEMEYYIKSIEIQQEKLNREIVQMYDKALQHRNLVQKMKPSTAIKQISQIKCNVQSIINNAQSTFEQAYMQKYKNFKNYVAKIGKPEDIGQAFSYSMGQALKQRFMQGMTKVAFKIKELNKQEIVPIQTVDQSVQTEKINNAFSKGKINPRQEKRLNQKYHFEIENLKKAQNSTAKQNAENIRKLKILQQKHVQLQQNYESIKELYGNKSNEYDSLKLDTSWVIEEKQKIVERLQSQISRLKNYKFKVQTGVQANTSISCSLTAQSQTQAQYLIADVQSQVVQVLKNTNQKFVNRLSIRQSKIRQLQKELRQSSNVKNQFTSVINSLCNQLNIEHFKFQMDQTPSLPKLIHITSMIFDSFRAERNAKNILLESLNRCSIDQQQRLDTPQQSELKSSFTRRNAKASIILRQPTFKRISSLMPCRDIEIIPIDYQRRGSDVNLLSIGCQTEFISDRMTNILNQMQNFNQREIQTQAINFIQNKNDKIRKIHFNQRTQGSSNQQKRAATLTQRTKTRQQISIKRPSHQKLYSKQTQEIDLIDRRGEQVHQTGRLSQRKQVKTAQKTWRQKFKMIHNSNNCNTTDGFKSRKYFRQRQAFQTINLDQKNQSYAINKVPADQIRHLIQNNKQNRETKNITDKQQFTNIITPFGQKNNNNIRESQQDQGIQSLFQIKKLLTVQHNTKRQSPKKLLDSVRRLKKKDKMGYKQIVFSLLQNSNQKKVESLISRIIMDRQTAFGQQIIEKMNLYNSKQTPPEILQRMQFDR